MENLSWQLALKYENERREPKEIVFENTPEDGLRKNTIVADDWSCIPVGYCRRCKKKLANKYAGVYWEVWPNEIRLKLCFETSYCETCSKVKAATKHVGNKTPKIIDIEWDAFDRERLYYEDGSVIETGDEPK